MKDCLLHNRQMRLMHSQALVSMAADVTSRQDSPRPGHYYQPDESTYGLGTLFNTQGRHSRCGAVWLQLVIKCWLHRAPLWSPDNADASAQSILLGIKGLCV